MLRRTQLYAAGDPAAISSGLFPDLHALRRPLWEEAENVVFYSGKVRRRKADGPLLAVGPAPVRGLSQQRTTDGARWLWFALGANVYRWAFGDAQLVWTMPSYTEHQNGLHPATYVDFTHYGDFTVINNGRDPAQLFQNGAAAPLTDAPEVAAKYMKKLNFMMAYGTGTRGTGVSWSDADDIEDWTATATNAAGTLYVEDLDTAIAAAERLGSGIAVYAEDQMGMISYTSLPYYFGQKVLLDGIGAVSKLAVTGDGKTNVGVGRNGVWWTDGNSYRYIDKGYIRDYFQDRVNWGQSSKITALRNDLTNCYEFGFPMDDASNVSETWSVDTESGGWSKLPPAAIKNERRLWDHPIVGLSNGQLRFDASAAALPAPLTLRTRPLTMQLTGEYDIHYATNLDEVELMLHSVSNVEFRIGGAHEKDGAYSWRKWQTATATSKTHRIEQGPDGVYWKVEFRSTADNWDLDLQGFALFGKFDGSKRG